jgi:hypothetical protein
LWYNIVMSEKSFQSSTKRIQYGKSVDYSKKVRQNWQECERWLIMKGEKYGQ